MKLKIPPVLQVSIAAVCIWLINRYLNQFNVEYSLLPKIAGICIVLGVLVMLAGIYAFGKMKTTVDPMHPEKASKLVTLGIYNLTRNPMYLGMLLMLLGWAFKLGNPMSVLVLIGFVWFMTRFQIKPEEEALRKIFGVDYESYCNRVRRWL